MFLPYSSVAPHSSFKGKNWGSIKILKVNQHQKVNGEKITQSQRNKRYFIGKGIKEELHSWGFSDWKNQTWALVLLRCLPAKNNQIIWDALITESRQQFFIRHSGFNTFCKIDKLNKNFKNTKKYNFIRKISKIPKIPNEPKKILFFFHMRKQNGVLQKPYLFFKTPAKFIATR